jgi:hypothetical protein
MLYYMQVDLAESEDVVVTILNSCVQFLDAILQSVVISFSMRAAEFQIQSWQARRDEQILADRKKAPWWSFR